MANRILFVLLFVLTFHQLFSQSETNTDGSILLRHERTYGLNLNSSGYGISYSRAVFYTSYNRQKIEFDFNYLKHSKEIKSVNSYYENAKSFVYGKLNYVYIFRAGYGLQRTTNTKPLINGVEVRQIYTAGLSTAFTKPVYLYVSVPDTFISSRDYIVAERYDPMKHSAHEIKGRGPFYKGFDEISIYPGLYGRAGFNFEFGSEYESIRAIEVGALLDAYLKPIPIMAYTEPSRLFLNFYVSVHFGYRYNKK